MKLAPEARFFSMRHQDQDVWAGVKRLLEGDHLKGAFLN
jgi:hypothetical protein